MGNVDYSEQFSLLCDLDGCTVRQVIEWLTNYNDSDTIDVRQDSYDGEEYFVIIPQENKDQ